METWAQFVVDEWKKKKTTPENVSQKWLVQSFPKSTNVAQYHMQKKERQLIWLHGKIIQTKP